MPSTFEPSGRAAVVGLQAGRGPLGQIFATASDDVLIYGAPGTTLRELRWLTRDGTPAGSTSEPIDAWDLRIAPDGRRIVVTEIDRQLRTLDVFIRTGSQPAPARLSLSTDVDESGVWSPDGLRIAWAGQRRKVMLRGAGAVLPEQTIATFDSPVQVWDWSRDGRSLLIGRKSSDTGDDLWIQPPVEGATAQPYTTAPFDQVYGAFSPDGRSIAYASNESGQFDIYVDSFPKPGTRVRVTTAGGTEPRWSNDGRELFFRRGSAIHVGSLRSRIARSDRSRSSSISARPIRAYDVSRDGRFLVNVPAEQQLTGADASSSLAVPRHRITETRKHGTNAMSSVVLCFRASVYAVTGLNENRNLERQRHPRAAGAAARMARRRKTRHRLPAGNQGVARSADLRAARHRGLLELLARREGLLGRRRCSSRSRSPAPCRCARIRDSTSSSASPARPCPRRPAT